LDKYLVSSLCNKKKKSEECDIDQFLLQKIAIDTEKAFTAAA
jgi:hypothetical protein